VLIVSDQLTKAWITPRYGPCGSATFHPVIGKVAGFSYVCNTGTAFSRFRDSPIVWLPVLIAASAVFWLWYRSLASGHLPQQIAFGMIIGGASGNLIDRARLGYVVDFVDLRLSDTLRWYVFNVADSSIVLGVCLLAFAFWRYETGGGTPTTDQSPPPAPADPPTQPHPDPHRGS
jgi:signal peptidase II